MSTQNQDNQNKQVEQEHDNPQELEYGAQLELAKQVPGLTQHLDDLCAKMSTFPGATYAGSAGITALKVLPAAHSAAYILGQHRWKTDMSSGIEMSVFVGVFHDGKTALSDRIVYRDMYDGSRDNWFKAYDAIAEVTIEAVHKTVVTEAANKMVVIVGSPTQREKKGPLTSFEFSPTGSIP